ncbi:PucR family transcriptional regulator ligand-binding domain-containing protein [Clostridium sp. WLY-B-L2]|uniref:PucR family transcriptional regulator ligand-binding domain-containing protein n=1 Tax=Clostridium aromativorans TaxID=2836848 RepID=A0ABS8N0P4_9CLOT|nr:PucR family transcriptional regulator [Clostridium aromativorans]MCC9293367.1 PucR family transcriptional regulator ligand-binding domain-containing protein [Clostridium aromativorans]
MAIQIKDLLSLNLFKSAVIVSGKNGISNEIKRVNFADCPIVDDIYDKNLVKQGDIFISSLYIVKNSTDKMFKLIDFCIKSESCGMFVINEYIKKLPDKIIELSNGNNFPIILIDADMPYAEIIKTVTEMIFLEQSNVISEMRLEKLLNKNITTNEVIYLAKLLNSNFKKNYASIYINTDNFTPGKNHLIKTNLKNLTRCELLRYKKGSILIVNFNIISEFISTVNYIKNLVDSYKDTYYIGISNSFSNIKDFNLCIKQCISSFEIAKIIDGNVVYYKDLNVYKILYPLIDTIYLNDFYNEIFIPIKKYDDYYNADLIKTINTYFENDGDYKKTSLKLHQHENTIRYRILKAKKILNLEHNHIKFIEQMSIALKINKLKNNKKY